MVKTVGNGKDKVVMVTGGSGLVGRAVEWAVTEGGLAKPGDTWIFLSSKDGNLTKEADVRALYEKFRPTHVLHIAAMVGGLFRNLRQPAEMFYNNILMNTYVIGLAHEYGVKKCVSMLSTCIMPDGIACPMSEKDVHLGPPHPSNFAYAYAKRMIDVQNEALRRQYGTRFTSIVPVNIFGQFDEFNLEDSHVVPGLLHKMYLAEKSKEPIVCWGTGKPLRQFVYSRDIARAMVWMTDNYDDPEPLICVGDNCEITVKDCVDLVAKAMDFKGKIVWDSSYADGQYRKTAGNAKFKSLNPDFKFTSMEQALKESADWFKANYATCRK